MYIMYAHANTPLLHLRYSICGMKRSPVEHENESWEGVPPKLLKMWDKDVVFGVFAGDCLSKESIITISKLDKLDNEVGS